MRQVLIISSFVAASHIGANASSFCLRKLGHNTIILPTTLMGRHPGWGVPGGGPVSAEHLSDMWQAICAQNLKIDAVLTGYMGAQDHISLCIDIIKRVKSDNPQSLILVDPVLGDFQDKAHDDKALKDKAEKDKDQRDNANNGRLYIPEARADAICNHLIHHADIITPNLWELGYITQDRLKSHAGIIERLNQSGKMALVTSVPANFEHDSLSDDPLYNAAKEDDSHIHNHPIAPSPIAAQSEIGALLYNKDKSYLSYHPKFLRVPHGGGDSLAALFLGHLLHDLPASEALQKSVASLYQIMAHGNNMANNVANNTALSKAHHPPKQDINGAALQRELPLIAAQHAILSAPPVKFRELDDG